VDAPAAISKLEQAVVGGDEDGAAQGARVLLDLGMPPTGITAVLSQVMARLGEQFQRLDIFVPDLLIAADAFGAAMHVLEPALRRPEGVGDQKGTVVIGVVEGDIHTLGKSLVAVMLKAAGFQVQDLGRDVEVARFAQAAAQCGADIIAMSSLMTTTMGRMSELLDLLTADGVRGEYRVIVGGAPVTQQFADEIGADGYAEDAPGAVALANRLMRASPGQGANP